MTKITVVTVCFNAAKILEETINSVINQTYPNIEYIIIDGSSTDGTIDIIKQYEGRISKWVSEPDKGIYDAMNKGLEMASGEYVNFMNAGDGFYNEKTLEDVASRINSNVDVVFGDVAITIDGLTYQVPSEPFYEHLPLHHSMGFNHQCTFVKTEVAKKFLFDLKFKLAADYNMIVSIYRAGGTFQQLRDLAISCYDISGESEKKRRLHIFETLRVDKPNRKLQNYIHSYFLFYILCARKNVGKLLSKLFPVLVKKWRNSRMILLYN